MQRKMSNEELSAYLSRLQNLSENFEKFLHDYVTGSIWIRSRGEEDVTVWGKLKGDELEIAKNIIVDELNIISDFSYIRAVGYFRDPKAIPVLKRIIENLPEKYLGEKLLAAKVMYDWIGYDEYLIMLENACKYSKGELYDYLVISIEEFTSGFDKSKKEHYIQILNSKSKSRQWDGSMS